MNPARAMGLFLRTWRAEWARLSRAQLTIAIAARCPRRSRITPAIIRQWEKGQPPQSSEELLALLEVMGRHGLGAGHREQFRNAVYAACASHLYPELLNGEDVAYREDIEEIARGLLEPMREHPRDANLVTLVAVTGELERALFAADAAAGSPAQRRRQSAALACCRAALASSIPWPSPFLLPYTPDLLSANAAFLEATFGPGGLGGDLSVPAQRMRATALWAHAGQSSHHGRLLLDLAEAAEGRGEQREASRAFLGAVHYLAEQLKEGAYQALKAPALRHLARVESLETPGYSNVGVGHHDLAWAALAEGDHAAAESWCAAAEEWMGPRSEPHPQTRQIRCWLAAAEGDWETVGVLIPPGGHPAARELAEMGRPVSYRGALQLGRELGRRRRWRRADVR